MDGIARNKRIAVNIKTSGIMRGASILVNLLLVPMLLHFLGERNYGVWLTISSFLGWSTLLDLGVGNGLKNRLSEALADGRKHELSTYTSSAYAMLSVVALSALVLASVLIFVLDWNRILNVHDISAWTLRITLLVFFFFFCVKLVLNQVLNIGASKQFTSIADVANLLMNIGILAGVFVAGFLAQDKLIAIAWIFGAVPSLVLLGLSIWAFRGHYKNFRPSFKAIDLKKGKDVMSLGSRFFLIQLAGIIIFSTDNLIISYFLDPALVTGYHISFRYFGVATLFFSILVTPIWPAYTDAYKKGDHEWIRSITKKLIQVWALLVLAVIAMLIMAPTVYRLWIGDQLVISWGLSAMMALYTISLAWGTIFVTFINGTGKLKMQVIFSLIAGLVNIPLSVFFIRYTDLGTAGVMLATIICLSYGPVISVIQYKKLLSNTAKGIWNQ